MDTTEDIAHKLNQLIGDGKVKHNFTLAPYTTFKVGGEAEFFVMVHTDEELINAIRAAQKLSIPYIVLGGASNVVVFEEGIKGLVIKNMVSYKELVKEDDEFVWLKVGSGYPITRLSKETAEEGYEGFEYHLGLPGTIGGGVVMNSKWPAHPPIKYIGDVIESAVLLTPQGELKEVDHDYFNFSYGYSILQNTQETLISVVCKLRKADPNVLVERGKEAREYRNRTQPHGIPSSGCFFKNTEAGESAGKMIDEAGLKGFRIGDAEISDIHANFIINRGNATTADVKKLVAHIKEKVKAHSGVDLKEEVILI